MISIPNELRFIFDRFISNNFECYAVGGCVRDSLLGAVPDDWDFTTNASPDEIINCFKDFKLVTIGKNYGTIGIINNDKVYEITTFRTDGDYKDQRHPDSVSFSGKISDDLKRRDFTVNSMAFNEIEGLIDPFGGQEDLKNKIIRCTGDPNKRFEEDAIRIIRALRFSSKLGFTIEDNTHNALKYYKDNLLQVHPQRLKKEFSGLILGKDASVVLREYSDILSVIIPEIGNMISFKQNNPHHIYDVWEHTLKAFELTPEEEELKLAVLFHDIGKPNSKTTDSKNIDHFKGHQTVSALIADKTLKRFGFSSDTVLKVTKLIQYHDERFKQGDIDIKNVLGVLGADLFRKLLCIQRCDILAQSPYRREEKLSRLSDVKTRFEEILRNNECYSMSQLSVNGEDLKNIGFSGKEIGITLNKLLQSVISGKCKNEKDSLIKLASSFFD